MIKEDKKFWFPSKKFGWGWGLPVKWQGWVVLAIYVLAMLLNAIYFTPYRYPISFAVCSFLLTAALIFVSWLKGEPPRWRWGK
jgi:hypothetical protein